MGSVTVMRESLVLGSVCLADLLATLLLIRRSYAYEGNPLMAYYLGIGIGAFVLVKLVLVVFPIFVLEWTKQYRPQLARRVARLVILAYVALYLLLSVGANVRPIVAARLTGEGSCHVVLAEQSGRD